MPDAFFTADDGLLVSLGRDVIDLRDERQVLLDQLTADRQTIAALREKVSRLQDLNRRLTGYQKRVS